MADRRKPKKANTELTEEKQRARERQLSGLKPFKPGQSGNPNGRKKGSRNKLGEDFLSDALAAWNKHGPEALTAMATEEPAKFCSMIAGILPKELNVNHNEMAELSDEQLARGIAILEQLCASHAAEKGSQAETRH